MSTCRLFTVKIPPLLQIAVVKICEYIFREILAVDQLKNVPQHLANDCEDMMKVMKFRHELTILNIKTFDSVYLKNIKYIVWNPLGHIDMVGTFNNIKPILLPKERLKLSCYLFMETEVRNLWESVDFNSPEGDELTYDNIFLINYIIRYFHRRFQRKAFSSDSLQALIEDCIKSKYYYPFRCLYNSLNVSDKRSVQMLFCKKTGHFSNHESINILVLLLNEMDDVSRENFLFEQAHKVLFPLAYFFPSKQFIAIIDYFHSKKYLKLVDLLIFCRNFGEYWDICPRNAENYNHVSYVVYQRCSDFIVDKLVDDMDKQPPTIKPLAVFLKAVCKFRPSASKFETKLIRKILTNNIIGDIITQSHSLLRKSHTDLMCVYNAQNLNTFIRYLCGIYRDI